MNLVSKFYFWFNAEMSHSKFLPTVMDHSLMTYEQPVLLNKEMSYTYDEERFIRFKAKIKAYFGDKCDKFTLAVNENKHFYEYLPIDVKCKVNVSLENDTRQAYQFNIYYKQYLNRFIDVLTYTHELSRCFTKIREQHTILANLIDTISSDTCEFKDSQNATKNTTKHDYIASVLAGRNPTKSFILKWINSETAKNEIIEILSHIKSNTVINTLFPDHKVNEYIVKEKDTDSNYDEYDISDGTLMGISLNNSKFYATSNLHIKMSKNHAHMHVYPARKNFSRNEEVPGYWIERIYGTIRYVRKNPSSDKKVNIKELYGDPPYPIIVDELINRLGIYSNGVLILNVQKYN